MAQRNKLTANGFFFFLWSATLPPLFNVFQLQVRFFTQGSPGPRRKRQPSSDSLEQRYLTWLDSQEPSSVIYASLGTLARLTTAQMAELALGLEHSGWPFIWAVNSKTDEFEEWMSENGFEERVKNRGWVIRGWAPQLLILKHGAVGGFFTHCGWNSTLEGIAAGVPLVTWPRFADQFCNEKLAVEVLGIGVSMGMEEAVRWGEEELVAVVGRERVKKAVAAVMEDEEKRKKAKEVGGMAMRAVAEGGSSHRNVGLLVDN